MHVLAFLKCAGAASRADAAPAMAEDAADDEDALAAVLAPPAAADDEAALPAAMVGAASAAPNELAGLRRGTPPVYGASA